MKILYLVTFATLLAVAGCNNSRQNYSYPYLPVNTAKEDLQVYDGKYRPQILGNGLVITGNVVNKSNSRNYKDVKLIVKYYSVTRTVMAEYSYKIYKYLNAGKMIKIRLNGPHTDLQSLGGVSVDVTGATQY